MEKKFRKRIFLIGGIAFLLVLAASICLLFLTPVSTCKKDVYLYVDRNDNTDSICTKLEAAAAPRQMLGMKILMGVSNYSGNIKKGCYLVTPSMNSLKLFHNLQSGRQTPVRLTIPIVRTMDQLAAKLSKMLEADSAEFSQTFSDFAVCKKYGASTATLPCLFIPNTYEVYWTVTPGELLARMKKESDAFWTPRRLSQAEAVGLSPNEILTLASIVEQETADNSEKPMIAGMYLNRLRRGMKLQADPTVKFAIKQFGLRRILHEHLLADDPYNTYLYPGLPPGPIAIPSVASIEATLAPASHNYIYMCAKEDFSGSHNFAASYPEHLKNARKYAEALDKRGIKN